MKRRGAHLADDGRRLGAQQLRDGGRSGGGDAQPLKEERAQRQRQRFVQLRQTQQRRHVDGCGLVGRRQSVGQVLEVPQKFAGRHVLAPQLRMSLRVQSTGNFEGPQSW